MSLPSTPPGTSPPQEQPSSPGAPSNRQLREIGGLAAWSVTSAKPGNGVELLRDGSKDTYWQSDGLQPHLVNVQFNKRVEVAELHLYLDHKADESYTPCRLSIRAGSTFNDLKDICIVELREPTGWTVVRLSDGQPAAASGGRQIRAFFYQVAVLANHQNGRDTHIRQILLFGPSTQTGNRLGVSDQLDTMEASRFSCIR